MPSLGASSLAACRRGGYKPPQQKLLKKRRVEEQAKMAVERTFSILKPDATERNLTGAINALIEGARSEERRVGKECRL